MTNETRTRRLIVTLPDVAAEEIADAATYLEELLPIRWDAAKVAVEVARDEYVWTGSGLAIVPRDIVSGGTDRATFTYTPEGSPIDYALVFVHPDEARQLAGQLLRAADEMEA